MRNPRPLDTHLDLHENMSEAEIKEQAQICANVDTALGYDPMPRGYYHQAIRNRLPSVRKYDFNSFMMLTGRSRR